jgi:antitoxin (DNA-binding transcriptional repressor) of toxin-antitoxin stability system
MSSTPEVQTIDSAHFPHPLGDVIAVASRPEEPDRTERDLMFTSGKTHWSADVRVRLRLADPVRQEANRRRLLEALDRPRPAWDPAQHLELQGEDSLGSPAGRARREIRISDAEASSDFAGVLARVRNGITVIIRHEDRPVAVLRPAEPFRRTISECIALAKAHEEETGKAPILDSDFASDVEGVLRDHEAWKPPEWE